VAVLVVLVAFLGTTSRGDHVALGEAPPAGAPSNQLQPQLAGTVPCAAGEVAIDPADAGMGDQTRCLPVGGAELDRSRVDPRYGRIAADLIERASGRKAKATRNVTVVCWSDGDWRKLLSSFREAGMIEQRKYWLGWAPRHRSVVNLSYPACQLLDAVAYRDGRSALPDVSAAVGTLAHEAMHVAGIVDEGIAECYSLQLTALTARALGAEPDQARLLAAGNAEYSQTYRAGTAYDSPDCYDGGPLDLHPESAQLLTVRPTSQA
jgi:hypothetical protein